VTNNAGASNVVRATAVKPIMSPVSMGIGLRAFGGMGMGRSGMGMGRGMGGGGAPRMSYGRGMH
jgi:hypothetical protein